MADVNVPQLPSGFQPVGALVKPVQPSGLGGMSLGDVVNMGATVQAYQKQKATMPYEIEQKKAESERSQLTTALQKQEAIGASMVSRINNPLIIAAEANPNGVNREALAADMEKWGKQQGKDLGLDPETTARLSQPYVQMALENPGQLRTYLKERHIAGLDQGARTLAGGIQPQYMTNAAGQIIQVNPATGQAQVMGGGQQTSAAPGAPAPAAGGGAPQPQPAGLGVNPTTASAQFVTQGATTAAQDWQTTYQAGREAPQRVAIFQNIKKLVPEAYTGVGSEKKQFAANLAQSIGIPVSVIESSSTDELAKNTKLLQLAGGNTDAARGLAELANPNTKMTKEGILRVTNQLIGIENMNIARSNFLGKYTQNPAQYQDMSARFNQIADPRIFQEMTPQEVAKLKASMSPAEQQDLTNKIQAAKQLGIIR